MQTAFVGIGREEIHLLVWSVKMTLLSVDRGNLLYKLKRVWEREKMEQLLQQI
ncbi:hypothetical protein [Microseira wollei]|uniref:Transposase n=1 Tax=Microseira wollei NIES-4236 TaxID=2530354 RepID=A0AAV3XQD4_9CYAN|nr:hypothetical protein [Microseira wollei]GET41862.1 hypothetical protein MiSe_66760 [Microseira wollei NIES-4236]